MTEDRTVVLLQAALDILTKCDNNSMSKTAFYDGTDCDGHCLMQDIKDYLDYLSIDE